MNYIHVRVCHIRRGKIAENRKKCKKRDFLVKNLICILELRGPFPTKSSIQLRLIICLVHPPSYLIAKGYVFYSISTNNG